MGYQTTTCRALAAASGAVLGNLYTVIEKNVRMSNRWGGYDGILSDLKKMSVQLCPVSQPFRSSPLSKVGSLALKYLDTRRCWRGGHNLEAKGTGAFILSGTREEDLEPVGGDQVGPENECRTDM